MKSDKIRVLHIISALVRGGAETLLVNMTKNMTKYNDNLDLVVVGMNTRIDETLKNELMKSCNSVYFLKKEPHSKNPKYLIKLFKIVKKHRIQVIHSHDFGSKFWAIGCKVLMPSLKLVFTIHTTNMINQMGNHEMLFHKRFVDMNISISEVVYKECLENQVTKVVKIYNGIDVFSYSNKTNKIRSKNGIFTIINVARILHTVKGQDVLIRAIKLCKDRQASIQCNFVGGVHPTCEDSFEYLKQLTLELGLEQEIVFLGNRNDVAELLNNSDLFVLPSRQEGFGLVILEAMASSVAVISSNIEGPKELIKDGESGILFESENHEELAGKIMELYEDREKILMLQENALQYVKGFEISTMCNDYDKLYNSLIEKKRKE